MNYSDSINSKERSSSFSDPWGCPKGLGVNSKFTEENKYFFTISNLKANTEDSRVSKIVDSLATKDNRVYEFILSNYSESHVDSRAIKNLLSDTFGVFTMGANPVNVTLEGALYSIPKEDRFFDLITLYDTVLRGTQKHKLHIELTFYMKSTYYNINVLNLGVSKTSTFHDFYNFNLSGIASKYRVEFDFNGR